MFLKYLNITKDSEVIRNIKFKHGINLIVDASSNKITGNSVGKTTVLKLIDYCLGTKKKYIWEDPENKKAEYALVKDYLITNEVLITLCLVDDLDRDSSRKIIIERNFISRGNSVIRHINGIFYKDEEFEPKLKELILEDKSSNKPSFRQIISHNIRYKDLSLNNTLKTLDGYTSNVEYEALHLYLFGCEFKESSKKQEIFESIKQEDKFKSRLEKKQTKSAYEAALELINTDIDKLETQKSTLNINENFEGDLNELNNIKYNINTVSSKISKLKMRKDLILEAQQDLEANKSDIDVQQIRMIYEQATTLLGTLHKSFDELVRYHNQMLSEKMKFITKELPDINSKLENEESILKKLLTKESKQALIISKSDSFEELEAIISKLNEKFRLKGEYETTINQLIEVEENLNSYNKDLGKIDDEIFSDDFENTVKNQLKEFNKYFSKVSELLYDEKYALKHDIEINRKGQKLYKITSFNTNFSSGKKQGEISCFDIAYTLFADDQNIPCLHFILNDKKELMHDNQLIKIANYVDENNIQFIASILQDKLPPQLNNDKNFILELSEEQKLFKIEDNSDSSKLSTL